MKNQMSEDFVYVGPIWSGLLSNWVSV